MKCSGPAAGRASLRHRRAWMQPFLCTLLSFSLLFGPAAHALAAATPDTTPARASTAEEILAEPLVRELSLDLEAQGFTVRGLVLEQHRRGEHVATVLPVEVVRPIAEPDPGADEWTRSIPIFTLVYEKEHDGTLDYAVLVRLDPVAGRSLMEFRFARLPDLRLRASDPTTPSPDLEDQRSRYQLLGRLPDGTFDELDSSPMGAPVFVHHQGEPVPQSVALTWACVKGCFDGYDELITWFQDRHGNDARVLAPHGRPRRAHDLRCERAGDSCGW